MYKINLLPSELQRDISIDVRKLVKRAIVALAAILLISGYSIFLFNYYSTKKEACELEKRLKQLEAAVKKVEEIKKQRRDNEQAVEKFKELLNQRLTWACVLKDIDYNLPEDMWLGSIDISYTGRWAQAEAGDKELEQMKTKEAVQKGRPKSGQTGTGALSDSKTSAAKQEGTSQQASLPVPDTLAIEGYSRTVSSVGVFINNLNKLPYFKSALLEELGEDEKYAGVKKFKLIAEIKEGGR